MLNRFIEFIGLDGSKLSINPFYIITVAPNQQHLGATQILVFGAAINVKHSYNDVLKMLAGAVQ